MVLLFLEVLLVLLVLKVGMGLPILRQPGELRVGMVRMVVVELRLNLPQFVVVRVLLVEMVHLARVKLLPPVLDKEGILGLLVLVVRNSDLR